METWEWIVLAVAVGLIVVLAVALMRIRQREPTFEADSGRSTTAQSPDPEREWPSAA